MAPKKEIGEASGSGIKHGRGRTPKRDRGGGGRGGGGHHSGGEDTAVVPMEEDMRSLSPARVGFPVGGGFWEDIPIPEFTLILYQPLWNTQWLP